MMISLIGSNFGVRKHNMQYSGLGSRGSVPGGQYVILSYAEVSSYAEASDDRPEGRRNAQYEKHNTRNAFTLIEVMISIIILSIGLVLILQTFGRSLIALRTAEDYLKATNIGANKLAQMQIKAKEDWDSFKKDGLDERFKTDGIEYVWKVDVVSVKWLMDKIPDIYKTLNEVKTTLSWKEGKRKGIVPLITYMISPAQAK